MRHKSLFVVVPLFIAYVCYWCILSPFVLHDYVNHLARCLVISELLLNPNSPFHQLFVFKWSAAPYILGDAALAATLSLFPLEAAGKLWVVISFLLYPLSVLLYLKSLGVKGEVLALAALIAAYLSTNWFFLAGYFNFTLGVPLVFLALAAWQLYLKRASQARAPLLPLAAYSLFCLSTVACYLMHLASFFFLGVILGASMLARLFFKQTRLREALFAAVPLVCLALFYVLQPSKELLGADYLFYRSALGKFQALGLMFFRFDFVIDAALFSLFGLICLTLLLCPSSIKLKTAEVRTCVYELGFVILVLAIVFCVMPLTVREIYDIDSRALPFFFSFVFFIAVVRFSAVLDEGKRRLLLRTFLGALVLAVLNLVYLAAFFSEHDARIGAYQEAVEQIPAGKIVFPVSTTPDEGRMQTTLHAGALYTALREGLTPYVFSKEFGYAMQYFSYKEQQYAPNVFWYSRNENIDWEEVSLRYDYVISTLPYDQERIDFADKQIVFINEAAVVYGKNKVLESFSDSKGD